jgi:hypothetical protein
MPDRSSRCRAAVVRAVISARIAGGIQEAMQLGEPRLGNTADHDLGNAATAGPRDAHDSDAAPAGCGRDGGNRVTVQANSLRPTCQHFF